MKKIIAVAVALAALAGVAGAEPGPRNKQLMAGGPGGPEAMTARILQRVLENPVKMKELGISEEQASKLQAGFYELEKKMVTLRSNAELAQIELRHLMDADSPDKEAVMAAVEKAGAARIAIQKAAVEQRLLVRDVLGDETANKIRQLIGKRMNHARGGWDDDDRPRFKQRDEDQDDGRGERRGDGKARRQQDQPESPDEN